MLKSKTLLFVLVCLVLPAFLLGQGYVQQMGTTGNVNWTQQMIRCTGVGGPNPNVPMAAQRAGALRAAKVEALRNLLETVKGVYLTSESTVEMMMLTSDVIRTRVEGTLRGFRVVDTRYMSTGDVEVDVEVPLTGVVLDALLPQDFGGGALVTGGQVLCPTCGQPWPHGKAVPSGVTLIQSGDVSTAQASTGGVYTGLVVDARGLQPGADHWRCGATRDPRERRLRDLGIRAGSAGLFARGGDRSPGGHAGPRGVCRRQPAAAGSARRGAAVSREPRRHLRVP